MNIRNFCIIAHIDHGKSTLADRILEHTGLLNERTKRDQFLDKMDLERERGITIKAQTVRIPYKAKDGKEYILNLIDTPGHVDFSYEVSRSLAACEGALLLIDVSQGIQAQTLANSHLAVNGGLEIIPVLNKIDIKNTDPDEIKNDIENVLAISSENTLLTSAKTGAGIDEILETIVTKLPPPKGEASNDLRALIFDLWYDSYQGTVIMVRVVDGEIHVGQKIYMMATKKIYEVTKLGYFSPDPIFCKKLSAGEVGFVISGIKSVHDTKIGDTITCVKNKAKKPLTGFKEIKPMVFSAIYPIYTEENDILKKALEKLYLNDPSFTFEPESSNALGYGYRCGFLGLLHMDIVTERLEREFKLSLINTAPTVKYKIVKIAKKVIFIDNPDKLPRADKIDHIEEPFLKLTIHTPSTYIGPIFKLCEDRRSENQEINYLAHNKVLISYDMPFSEMLMEFYDRLKSVSRGYATLDYEFLGYKRSKLIKMDILINGKPIDALSVIVHKDKAYRRGRDLTNKMKKIIPRQLFEIAIQAAIGNRIIAREKLQALGKNVTAKCYGGDVTRKRKLWEKQKAGKKRMKKMGQVEIPQDAFMAVLKID